MKDRRLYAWLFLILATIILISPLIYWSTGIGQAAAGLSAQITRRPDGSLLSSPKAEALHSLSLPMRLERMLVYPLLLLSFQLSGGAVALRYWLERQIPAVISKLPFKRARDQESNPFREASQGVGGKQSQRSPKGRLRTGPKTTTEGRPGEARPPVGNATFGGNQKKLDVDFSDRTDKNIKLNQHTSQSADLRPIILVDSTNLARLSYRVMQTAVGGLRWAVPLLLFILIFETALSLLYLPFNFYRSFIVGHQFGLSTYTVPGWFNDWFKGLLINLVLDGLTWTGLYGLMRLLPRRWPIPAGALLVLFSVILVLLTPILITPLFYEVRPLEDPILRARILALADRAHMHVEAVEVIDASSKTTEVNAYFTGFGGAQRIVLYDTLLTDYTPDQIEVVLAHEMGHWYYHHVLLGVVGLGAVGWLGLFGLQWLLNHTWRWLGLHGPADIAGLPYVLVVITIASYLALPVENTISRYAESQADHFALTASQKPSAMIELFEQFAVQNLSLVDAPAWEKFIFYTHPSIAERVSMAERSQKASK